jgi:hypothetical protein
MEIKSDLPLDDLSLNPNQASTDSPQDNLSANPAPTSGVMGSILLEKIFVYSLKELAFKNEMQ